MNAISTTHPSTPGAGAPSQRTLLHVDWTRCDGHGSCAELLPDLLTTDEWGYPIAHGELLRGDVVVPVSEVEHARRAVEACPLMALRLRRSS